MKVEPDIRAVTLSDGRIFAAEYDRAAVYDPVAKAWTAAASPGWDFAKALAPLADGRALLAGDATTPQLYDPAADRWSPAPSLGAPDGYFATATPLTGGRVLVVGGGEAVFDPAGAGLWLAAPAPSTGREGHAAAGLPDGRVVVVGGDEPFNATADVFLGGY